MKNTILIISLLMNLWMQFSYDIFYKYVELTFCKQNGGIKSIQSGEFEIAGMNILHIPYVISPQSKYSTVDCMDGTSNKGK